MFDRNEMVAKQQVAGMVIGQGIAKCEPEPTILENIDRLIRQAELRADELRCIKEKLNQPNGFLGLTHSELSQIMQRY